MSKKVRPSLGLVDMAQLLASPRTAQWVLAAMALITLSVLLPMVIAGSGAGEAAQRFASIAWPLLGLYIALAGSLLACMVRRLKGVARKAAVDPRPRRRASAATVLAPVDFDADAAADVLRRAGYRHVAQDEAWVWGVKHRWSPIGTILLHVAVLLGIVGAALAILPGVDRVEHVRALLDVETRLPFGTRSLTVSSLNAVRSADGTFLSLSALAETESGRRIALRPDLPAIVGPFSGVVLEEADISARFSVMPTSTATPDYGRTHALRLSRAGSVDRLEIGTARLGTYRVIVRSDAEDAAQAIVRVERKQRSKGGGEWRLVQAEKSMAPGDMLRVGRARLRFDGFGRWASLRIHKAPSAVMIFIALVLSVLGASMRLLLPRAEATIARSDGGSIATVSVDAYRGSRSASAQLAEALVSRP